MPRKEIAEHLLTCARTLYEETDIQTGKIAQMLGVAPSTLSGIAIRNGWAPRPGRRLRQHEAAEPTADIGALGARIRSTIDREIAEAERQLGKPGSQASRIMNSERVARTLSSLTKTLNELKRLEAAGTEAEPKAEDDFDVEIVEERADACGRAK